MINKTLLKKVDTKNINIETHLNAFIKKKNAIWYNK